MKTKLFSIALLSLLLVNCGGEEKKEETTEKDTVVAEEPKEPAYEYTYEVAEVDVPEKWAVVIGDSTTLEDLKTFFPENMPKVGKTANLKPNDMAEAPMGIYYNFSPDKKFYTEAAIVITDSTRKVKAPGKLKKLPAGKAVKVSFVGSYEELEKGWNDAMAYAKEKGLEATNVGWEQYISDPGAKDADQSKLKVDIYMGVKPAAK
ncbi:MAG TPA: GyrI-like domain-containing protein [Flavobacteriales bacterium]|nr:GyrI-like domain-containing protein [Flavobacteriales bacterium]